MSRFAAPLSLMLVLALCVTAQAGKKKNAVPANTVVGKITAVSDDGKTITVIPLGGKKKAAATQVKVNDKTQVQYIGISDKSEQKLTVGYAVLVSLDEQDRTTASVIAAAKFPVKMKKKKKKNNQ